jgi:hypothetical protein
VQHAVSCIVTAPALGVDACRRAGQECVNRFLALILCLCLGRPYLWSRDECPMIICYTNVVGQLNSHERTFVWKRNCLRGEYLLKVFVG